MKNHNLSKRSRNNLKGVRPEIVAVVFLALKLSAVDFAVIDGVRSFAEQEWYFKNGKSKTMDSLHLIQEDGFNHAVDLMPVGFNTFDDIPDKSWALLNKAMEEASETLNYIVGNGFDMWGWDKPHWQDRKLYI